MKLLAFGLVHKLILSFAALTTVSAATTMVLTTPKAVAGDKKRDFNPLEETNPSAPIGYQDLDYHQQFNPFQQANNNAFWGLNSNFYTPANQSANDYDTFDLADLNPTKNDNHSNWLSEFLQYLSFQQDKTHNHSLVVSGFKDDVNKKNEFDFTNYQNTNSQIKWEASQLNYGIFNEKLFLTTTNSKPNYAPTFYPNPQDTSKWNFLFSGLTQSDFQVNTNSDDDTSELHQPHDFNLSNLYHNEETIDTPIDQDHPTNKLSNLLVYLSNEKTQDSDTDSYKNYDDYKSIFKTTLQYSTDGNQQPIYPTTSRVKIEPFSTSTTDGVGTGMEVWQKVAKAHDGMYDSSQFEGINNLDNFPQSQYWTPDARYFPNLSVNSQSQSTFNSNFLSLTLPNPYNYDSSDNLSNTINFGNYYNSSDSGLSTDVKIENTTLTYNIKVGGVTQKSTSIQLSPNFLQFLNLCLSPLQLSETKNTGDTNTVTSTLNLFSSHLNDIKLNSSLNTMLSLANSSDDNVPFAQTIVNGSSSHAKTARSFGFGMMNTLPKDGIPVQTDPDKAMVSMLMQSNQVKLYSDNSGITNTIPTTLDYLLAINPTTTNTFVNSKTTDKPVQVGINPYYIAAAVNAHNAYNFWLSQAANRNWNQVATNGVSTTVAQAIWRDLIMRGFIKNKAAADSLWNLIQTAPKGFKSFINQTWLSYYTTQVQRNPEIYLSTGSYVKMNSLQQLVGNPDFYWNGFNLPTPTSAPLKQWVKTYNGGSQAPWVNFCVAYGVGPSTFSVLNSIPNDYTFCIPSGSVTPNANPSSALVSSVAGNIATKSLTWEELLAGMTFDYQLDAKSNGSDTLVLGANNSNTMSNSGIYSLASQHPTVVKDNLGVDTTLSLPAFNNIKLATCTTMNSTTNSNFSHINAQNNGYDCSPIQWYSSAYNRDNLIKTHNDIDYLPAAQTHSVIALHKNKSQLNTKPEMDGVYSDNTYLITQINQQTPGVYSQYFNYDGAGNLAFLTNYNNWRTTIASVTMNENEKYYKSTHQNISGETQSGDWLMSGVAPEDYFSNDYLTTYNDYTTYKWAFHPSGLWCYNQQFHQDPESGQADYNNWDSWGLDYTLWGQPQITQITSSTIVPNFIKAQWQAEYQAIAAPGESPHLYTNNISHELAFRVTYTNLKFYDETVNQYVTPVQYVYYPDVYYNFGLKAPNNATISINDERLAYTNQLYGNFAPSNFNGYTNNYTGIPDASSLFSTSNILQLLSVGEIIKFYGSYGDNMYSSCNTPYSLFKQLYEHGWISIENIVNSDQAHSVSFTIKYAPKLTLWSENTALYDQSTGLMKFNPDFTTNANRGDTPIAGNPKLPANTGTWISINYTITDFRAIGTQYSTVKNEKPMSPMLIGLIVCAAVIPIIIIAMGFYFWRQRTKHKRVA